MLVSDLEDFFDSDGNILIFNIKKGLTPSKKNTLFEGSYGENHTEFKKYWNHEISTMGVKDDTLLVGIRLEQVYGVKDDS